MRLGRRTKILASSLLRQRRGKLDDPILIIARGQGFEPQLFGSEPNVLPLDDPRIF